MPEGWVRASVPLLGRAAGFVRAEEPCLVVDAGGFPSGDSVEKGLGCRGRQEAERIVD